MMEAEAVKVEQEGSYGGFIGLNHAADFGSYVLSHAELKPYLENNQRYLAHCAYPFNVADGFGAPPEFYATEFNDKGFILNANLNINQKPKRFPSFFAKLLFPKSLKVQDALTVAPDPEKGFGPNTYRINTISTRRTDNKCGCIGKNNKNTCIAHGLIAVKDRPGLFFRVRDKAGNIIENALIFFPDKPNEKSHGLVKFGEAFFLLAKGVPLNEQIMDAFMHTYEQVVNPSYGKKDDGVYHIIDKTQPAVEIAPIETTPLAG